MADSATQSTATTSNIQSTSGGGFARKSSGLVREFSQLDSWIFNVVAINVVIYGALTFGVMTLTYPHASLWLPFAIAGVFCSFEAIAYALFAAAMPRSGGDYVFQSRVLGGGTGTVFAFTAITVVQFLVAGLLGLLTAEVVLSPFFLLLGADLNAHWMSSFGEWIVTKPGILVCGVSLILLGLAFNVRGLRLYGRVQRYTFWIGAVLLVMFLIVMLFTSHSAFISHFNSFMSSNYGVKNAYQVTLNRGLEGTSTSFSLGATVLASVIAAFALIYPAYGVQQAGEIKRANSVRSNLKSMLGAEIASVIVLMIIGLLLTKTVGHDFVYASTNLALGGAENNPLPVAPFLGFLFAVAGNAAIFFWLGMVMCICWMATFFANAWLGASRNMMAMSADRILPEALGRVNRRLHVPLNALIVFSLANIPFLLLYVFAENFRAYTLGFFIISITAFGVTMIAAMLFPFKKKALYDASPAAKYTVAGFPLITISGAIFLAFAIFVDYQALFADELGINGSKGLEFIGGVYLFAIVVYGVAKVYRKRVNKLDLSMSYEELPVE
jgi:APA family basic amino acid/polyamine antiporter